MNAEVLKHCKMYNLALGYVSIFIYVQIVFLSPAYSSEIKYEVNCMESADFLTKNHIQKPLEGNRYSKFFLEDLNIFDFYVEKDILYIKVARDNFSKELIKIKGISIEVSDHMIQTNNNIIVKTYFITTDSGLDNFDVSIKKNSADESVGFSISRNYQNRKCALS